MSVIFVFVGQCGNQVGAAVTKALAESCHQHPSAQSPPQQRNFAGPFFSSDGFVRAVLVDAEPKVVDSVVRNCNGLIRPTNLVTGRSGRGNSWSLGYCGLPETDEAEVQAGAFRVSTAKDQLERDRTVLCRALKAIHAETRRCDDGMVEAIVVVHSLAGGTGSGLGCALVENIRHHFCCDGAEHDKLGEEEDNGGEMHLDNDPMSWGAPFKKSSNNKRASSSSRQEQQNNSNKKKKNLPPSILDEDVIREGVFGEPRRARFVCSVCVAPLVQGELAVQSINACLTLRTLVKNCDAIFLLRNDCHKLFRGIEHSHGASSSSSSRGGARGGSAAAESSFQSINNFFASMLVSALQGGRVFGCVAELLDATVDRVAGIDWNKMMEEEQDQKRGGGGGRGGDRRQQQQQGGRFEWSEFDPESDTNPANINKRPRPGPRLLTLIPWDPRASWAAGFRRSSVTATLCGRDTSRADVTELLSAYLCNEVRNLESGSSEGASVEALLCTVLDRSAAEAAAVAQLVSDQQQSKSASSARRAPPLAFGSAAVAATKPVLVLNQCSELCVSILMPFFRDAATKVDSGAYMHTYNVRGILEQVFCSPMQQQQQRGGGGRGPSTFGSSSPAGGAKRVSPRRSNFSERHHVEFARKFVNQALVDLLEYMNASFPM